MNLTLGFGGGSWWSWLFVSCIIAGIGILLFHRWKQRVSASVVRLAKLYLLVVAVPCSLLLFDNSFNFWALIIGIQLTIPWSWILLTGLTDGFGTHTLGGTLFICAEMNAILLYAFALLSSRRGPRLP